jgi:hypothetical protein
MNEEKLQPKLKLIVSPDPEDSELMLFEFDFDLLLEGTFTLQEYEHNEERIIAIGRSVLDDDSFQDKVLKEVAQMFVQEIKSKL